MTDSARSIAIAVLLGLVSASAPAGAADTKAPTQVNIQEAQRRYQRGRELYEENNSPAALIEFQRAYALAPSYRLLYDIAQVQYQTQDYPAALRTFLKYLEDGQGEISAQRREEVQKEIERLNTRVAKVRITVNQPQAEILVDDVPVGKAPLPEPVLVSIGRRKISATLPGLPPATRYVEVAGMDSIKVDLELRATSDPRRGGAEDGDAGSPAMAQKRRSFPWASWAITGGVGVAAGVTGVFALQASSHLNKTLATFGVTRAELDAAGSRTKTLALTTDILLGATAVGAGVSLVLTLTRGPDKSEPKASSLYPVRLGVGPGSVSISGAF